MFSLIVAIKPAVQQNNKKIMSRKHSCISQHSQNDIANNIFYLFVSF